MRNGIIGGIIGLAISATVIFDAAAARDDGSDIDDLCMFTTQFASEYGQSARASLAEGGDSDILRLAADEDTLRRLDLMLDIRDKSC